MSERSQRIVLWWAIGFAVIYGIAFVFLLRMVPFPSATQPQAEIVAFYSEHSTSIRVGSVIASLTSAFMLPLAVVAGLQMSRLEKGLPIWSILTICGGAMMSIFLVLPPLFWGVAAYAPDRAPDATVLMHQLACLTMTTTDQYYVFMWVAIVVICLTSTQVKHSPFPRWFGYLTAWIALMFEAGAFAFLPKTGPFAWDGLLVYWSPLTLFTVWIAVQCPLLFRAIKAQMQDEETASLAGVDELNGRVVAQSSRTHGF
jgi:hypothetical protein